MKTQIYEFQEWFRSYLIWCSVCSDLSKFQKKISYKKKNPKQFLCKNSYYLYYYIDILTKMRSKKGFIFWDYIPFCSPHGTWDIFSWKNSNLWMLITHEKRHLKCKNTKLSINVMDIKWRFSFLKLRSIIKTWNEQKLLFMKGLFPSSIPCSLR